MRSGVLVLSAVRVTGPLAEFASGFADELGRLGYTELSARNQVRVLACNRDTVVGRRNYPMLMLLARLGLRGCEVAALELDDMDWRRGELVIRGKGDRQERLPLPTDVGDFWVA